jgi:hypothetical protein
VSGYRDWQERIAMLDGRRCWMRGTVLCRGELDGHHLIPKQRIKRAFPHGAGVGSPWGPIRAGERGIDRYLIMATVGGEDVDIAELPVRTLDELLWDERNGILLCRLHHDRLEQRLFVPARSDLPARVEEFAAELGLGWSLDRTFGAV